MSSMDAAALGHPDNVAEAIQQAFDIGLYGDRLEAVRLFRQARTLAQTTCDQTTLTAEIQREYEIYRTESDNFRIDISSRNDPNPLKKVLIFADSLGLPRAEEKAQPDKGLSTTYAYKIFDNLKAENPDATVSVIPHCQRFMTTTDALQRLNAAADECLGSDVIFHIGLNDTANRMFLVNERLALRILPKEINDLMVKFAREYRNDLITSDDNHNYVTLDEFHVNVKNLIINAKNYGARSVTWCTTILPATKFWPGTPRMNWNFTRYNFAVLENSKIYGTQVLDIDRIIWQAGHDKTLVKDGMHLNPNGHQLFANSYMALWRII